MRTNIVIDDELMKSAMNFGEFSTKKALIEASLRLYIQLRQNQKEMIRQYHPDFDPIQEHLGLKTIDLSKYF
jgi:Arc/MetJ family transcription regulator